MENFGLKQRELADWQHRNFGIVGTASLMLGVMEEVGELSHAILKKQQGIREYSQNDYMKKELKEKEIAEVTDKYRKHIADAYGDILVYLGQVMFNEGIDCEEAFSEVSAKVLKRDWKSNPSGFNIDSPDMP
jgi:NTP pyrophosphatase (non-canonical NTP hydrolase)